MTDELAEAAGKSARSGFYLISGTTIATVIMAIAAIIIGRLLGPELYGDYNLAIIVPQILLLFADLGINTGIIKFASSSRSSEDNTDAIRIIRHGMLFRIIVGALVFGLVFAFSSVLSTFLINRPNLGYYVQIASISILFQIVFTTATSTFIGLDKTEYNALVTDIQAIGKTAVSITLVWLGFGIGGAVMGYVGGYIGAGIVGGILFLKMATARHKRAEGAYKKSFRALTSYGYPLYISTVLTGFLPLFQQTILAFFTSRSNFGNYRAALNFLTLISVVPTSITLALLPAFSRLDQSTGEKIKILFKRANKYTCLLIAPTTVLLLMFSRQIVQIVYGSTYEIAWLYLSLSCVIYFLVIIGYLGLSSLFNGMNETRITMKMTLISIATFACIAPILTYLYDVPGAILSSLIAGAISTIYAGRVARRKFRIEFDTQAAAKIYAISALAALPSIFLLSFTRLSAPAMLALGVVIYLLIYVTLVPLVRIVGREELQTIKRFVQPIRPMRIIANPIIGYIEKILETRPNAKK